MADPQKPTRKPANLPVEKASPVKQETSWIDLAISLVNRFSRYNWDILGVTFLALALVILIGLLGFTGGVFISPLVNILRRGLGWGSYILVGVLFLLGIVALRWKTARPPAFSLVRILAVEGIVFCLLALFSLLGGSSLVRTDSGQDPGGIVGWGLAKLFSIPAGPLWGGLFVVICLLIFLLVAFNIPAYLARWLARQSQANGAGPYQPADLSGLTASQPVKPASQPYSTPSTSSTPAPAPAKKLQLPLQFRKALRAEPPLEQKPVVIPPRDDRLPPLNLLIGDQMVRPDERQINLTAGLIEKTIAEFGFKAKVVGFRIGPTVTQFAVEPGYIEKTGPDGSIQKQKVRVSQISALARDLTLALSAERLRIEAPVPGRSYVGIEVPNSRTSMVRLRSILESDAFYKTSSSMAMALGRDVSGQPVVADLSRMPHLLIAGTTGSGKSICIEAITTCLVMNNTPDELRLVMIDPKMVELVRFNGLPHLLGKVETDLERILAVLKWALAEMDHRYRLLEQARARDIDAYNKKMARRNQPTLPRIVILIDELADLMMTSPDQTEHSLVRLAQLARATGMHLILATQRPSTDVVTGLIKANFPARISFTVASSIDSRVILDTTGAETLLGRGDMLFLSPEEGTPTRAQGVLITDQELERIIAYWQKLLPQDATKPSPWEEMMEQDDHSGDALVERAITVVKNEQHASASLLQRRLHIGYPRAARLIDELEEMGIVGPSQGGGREREVLVTQDDDVNEAESGESEGN